MNKHNRDLLDNFEHDLPVAFIEYVNDHYDVEDDIDDLDSVIRSYNESECDILFGDQNGIYIPKLFSELLLLEYTCIPDPKPDPVYGGTHIFYIQNSYKEVIAEWKCINKQHLIELRDNADNSDFEGYWDIWIDVLDKAELTYKGEKWYLDQDGHLWIKSSNYIDINY